MPLTSPLLPLPPLCLCCSVGHLGRFGHEFLELELSPSGLLRYANSSRYKADVTIRKQVRLGPLVTATLRRMVLDSGVLECDDSGWPAADAVGRQELELVTDGRHCRLVLSKLGSLSEMEGRGAAAEGLKTLYFFVQDLRCLVLALIALHFKLRPI